MAPAFCVGKVSGLTTLASLFLRPFDLSLYHNDPICHSSNQLDEHVSRNFFFFRYLNDWESDDVLFADVLQPFTISSQLNTRIWTFKIFSMSPCKFPSAHLTRNSSCYNETFTSAFWKAKSGYKVKVFVWIAGLKRLNTNNLFQVHKPIMHFDVFVMCFMEVEPHCLLFYIARWLGDFDLGLVILLVSCGLYPFPLCVSMLLREVGAEKEAKTLWRRAPFAWSFLLWLECEARLFKDSYFSPSYLWDRMVSLPLYG